MSNDNQILWLLDSGCTDHIVNDDKYFSEYVTLNNPVEVRIGDGRILMATKIGTVEAMFNVNGHNIPINLANVFYVKDMKANLISYSKVTERNKIVSKGDASRIYNPMGELIAIAIKEGSLYKLNSVVIKKPIDSQVFTCKSLLNMSVKERWHRTLGHVNFSCLDEMLKGNLLEGAPPRVESQFMK